MKLYIRQKVFSWRDRFSVMDQEGNDKYFVEGELFSMGKRLHVTDMTGTEVLTLRQKAWSFRPRYEVYQGDKHIGTVRAEFSPIKPRYAVDGLGWKAAGSFLGLDYAITAGSRQVAAIHKAFMSWGDSYELSIAEKEDELPALAVVLAIDCVLATQQAAAQSTL